MESDDNDEADDEEQEEAEEEEVDSEAEAWAKVEIWYRRNINIDRTVIALSLCGCRGFVPFGAPFQIPL